MRLCSTTDCNRVACDFPLHWGGVPIPRLCCVHMDDFMADLGGRVPPAEGIEGLARFRATHKMFHAVVRA